MDLLRILLVERDDDLRRALLTYLNDQPDFTVVGVARNGADALTLLEKRGVDLIVTGLLMPIMDGLMMLERMKSLGFPSRLKVVVLSSLATKALRERAYDLGAACYLVKPVKPAQLCACIRKCFATACCANDIQLK